jgi:ABC-type branched-subunit amino acid transport system ATPase component
MAILLAGHDVDFVMGVAHRVAVKDSDEKIADGRVTETYPGRRQSIAA